MDFLKGLDASLLGYDKLLHFGVAFFVCFVIFVFFKVPQVFLMLIVFLGLCVFWEYAGEYDTMDLVFDVIGMCAAFVFYMIISKD